MHTAAYKVDAASDRRRRGNVPRHILCCAWLIPGNIKSRRLSVYESILELYERAVGRNVWLSGKRINRRRSRKNTKRDRREPAERGQT